MRENVLWFQIQEPAHSVQYLPYQRHYLLTSHRYGAYIWDIRMTKNYHTFIRFNLSPLSQSIKGKSSENVFILILKREKSINTVNDKGNGLSFFILNSNLSVFLSIYKLKENMNQREDTTIREDIQNEVWIPSPNRELRVSQQFSTFQNHERMKD
jgi:hypothetical protein